MFGHGLFSKLLRKLRRSKNSVFSPSQNKRYDCVVLFGGNVPGPRVWLEECGSAFKHVQPCDVHMLFAQSDITALNGLRLLLIKQLAITIGKPMDLSLVSELHVTLRCIIGLSESSLQRAFRQ